MYFDNIDMNNVERLFYDIANDEEYKYEIFINNIHNLI